jgi:hypothetical protein
VATLPNLGVLAVFFQSVVQRLQADSEADGGRFLVTQAIVADALGMHLDLFQRIHLAPGSLTVIRYTPERPFLVRLSEDQSPLALPPAGTSSDAPVGGGAV